MKVTLFSLFVVAAIVVPSFAADTSEELAGKWSGNWKPQGGIPDATTIELTQGSSGRLTEALLNPPEEVRLVLGESAKGSPEQLKAWYYPGLKTGFEFVSPKPVQQALNSNWTNLGLPRGIFAVWQPYVESTGLELLANSVRPVTG